MNIIRKKLNPMTNADGDRRSYAIVYQGGIANLFDIQCANSNPFGRDAKRIFQGDFRTAETMATGIGIAGGIVFSFACNKPGDIKNEIWTDDLESQPFSDKFNAVFFTIGF